MIQGSVIRVLHDGPRIPAAALTPIGIHDRSRCWGVWIPAHSFRPGVGSQNNQGAEPSPAHLLISPIHPDLWPYVFHVEIKLRDRLGAMADVADILYKNHVNLVFVQCAPSGHRHATWSFIGEALDVREKIEALHRNDHRTTADRRDSIWTQARILMIRKLLSLRSTLIQADSTARQVNGDEGALLYDRFGLEGLEFSSNDMKTLIPEVTDEEIRAAQSESAAQRTKSIIHRVNAHLAHVWKTSTPDRLEFEYSTDAQQLLVKTGDFADQVERYVGADVLPTDALSSFENREHYVRLKILVQRRQRRLVAIRVHYGAHFEQDADTSESTRGALRDITYAIAKNGINLLEVSNTITARDAHSEKGSLQLIGETPSANNQALLENTKRDLERVRIAHYNPTYVSVEPHHHAHIFVSRRADPDAQRSELFRRLDDILKEVASELSIRIITTSAWTESVPERVLEDIRASDAVLQILTLKEGETQDRCDLTWLVSEYAAAAALKQPCVRLVDTSSGMTDADWLKLVRFSACALQPFDSNEDPIIRRAFRRAFIELNKEI